MELAGRARSSSEKPGFYFSPGFLARSHINCWWRCMCLRLRAFDRKSRPTESLSLHHCSCAFQRLRGRLPYSTRRSMKRFLQSSPHELHMPDTSDVRCLKRLRLSISPGELRLERDLHHFAMHWTRVNSRRWESECGVVLERKQDPMTFVLHLDQDSQVWIEISRSYPHEPPVITHVQHPYVCHVIVTLEPAMNSMMIIQSDTTIVYDKWSPVRQLSDLLDYLVVALSRQTHRDLETPTLLSDEDMQEEPTTILDLQRELSPNRFDLGYPKPNNGTMDECLL